MPCFYISTNVCLDGIDTEPIFVETTKAISSIIGKPEKFVMVVLKGSLAISFGSNKEPAVYAELISMGGITREVKQKLISTLGTILQDRINVPPARFFLKVYDTTGQYRSQSKL